MPLQPETALHREATFASERIVLGPSGARLMHGQHLVSFAPAQPGALHNLFDVMAACVTVLSPGPRLALLGFGAGAILAPLRALGWTYSIDAVDLSSAGASLLRRIAGEWIEPLHFQRAEASAWLARRRRPFDVVVEDLSIPVPSDLAMPDVCFTRLCGLLPRRLNRFAIVVVNAFTPGPDGWLRLIERLRLPDYDARVVISRDFDHKLLVCGRRLPPARVVGRSIRARLASIRSRQRDRIVVRSAHPARLRSVR